MEQIAIIDYSISQIFLYNLPEDVENIEEYIEELGHKPSECNYLTAEYIIINNELDE